MLASGFQKILDIHFDYFHVFLLVGLLFFHGVHFKARHAVGLLRLRAAEVTGLDVV